MLSLALGTLTTLSFAFPISANAEDLQVSGAQPTVIRSLDAGTEDAKPGYQSDVYIVQLSEPAVATYMGGTENLAATSNRATGANKLNTSSAASKNYIKHLRKKQSKFITDREAEFGHPVNVTYDYQIVFNGFAAELSAEEADALRASPGVKNVSRERFEVPLTDAGPVWINAPSVWPGPPNNVAHSKGEGIVVAVLDTGVNSDHPSYADIGGDGFDHTNPLGSGSYVPGSYCDLVDPNFCNDKLIGAWSFVPGDANYPSPEDSDGHGSHTSATATGNVVLGATLFAPTTSMTRMRISSCTTYVLLPAQALRCSRRSTRLS